MNLICKLFGHKERQLQLTGFIRMPEDNWMKFIEDYGQACIRCRYNVPKTTVLPYVFDQVEYAGFNLEFK